MDLRSQRATEKTLSEPFDESQSVLARLFAPRAGIPAALLSYVLLALCMPQVDLSDVGEVARIAASIAAGHGFSSPFSQPTGPTALIPPVYPYLLAAIFRLFGLFSRGAYWTAVVVNVVVHGLSCILLYKAAAAAFGRQAGTWAAVALGSFPFLFEPLVYFHVLGGYNGDGLFIPPNLIWYAHLTELSVVLLIWLTLRRVHWGWYGAAWGAACLTNPGILAVAPVFWCWWGWRKQPWRRLGLAAAVAFLCVLPWFVRNVIVFHRLVFIRDGLGIELKAGNQPGAKGLKKNELHPWSNRVELDKVAKLGEVEYARECESEALATIRNAPGEFVLNSVRRVGYYWLGTPQPSRHLGKLGFLKSLPALAFSALAFWGTVRAFLDGNRQSLLFASVLLLYPLVYYVTHTSTGYIYQYPVQPEMLALAAYAVFRKMIRKPEADEEFAGH